MALPPLLPAAPATPPGRDFWCIVALDDNGDAWILRRSPDAQAREVIPEFAGEDNGLCMKWAEGRPAGLYRLELTPWGEQRWDSEWDTGVDVPLVCALHTLPPLPKEPQA